MSFRKSILRVLLAGLLIGLPPKGVLAVDASSLSGCSVTKWGDVKGLEYRKRAIVLTDEAQRARRNLVASRGNTNTTTLRSEFKHYMLQSSTEKRVADLQTHLPVRTAEDGKVLSGMTFRDRPRVDGLSTFTDTGSSAKFRYTSELSQKALLDIGKDVFRNEDAELLKQLSTLEGFRKSNINKILEERISDPLKRQAFIDRLEESYWEEGVLRYRKYRDGVIGMSFDGVPTPGLAPSAPGASAAVKDTEFAKGITFIEHKMKNTQGEAARRTIVNKPRLPVSDDKVELLHNRECFLNPICYKNLKERLAEDIKFNLKKMNEDFDEVEFEATMELRSEFHKQGFDTRPIGRTSYRRSSYSIKIPSATGKPPLDVQVTIDNEVRELSLSTGRTLTRMPWIERRLNWSFQWHPEMQQFVHDTASGDPLHTLDTETRKIYFLKKDGTRGAEYLDARVEPIQVVELKVPEHVINFSEENFQDFPDLRAIAQARKDFVDETKQLNDLRSERGLAAFDVDKGKRATVRNGVTTPRKTVLTPAGDRVFEYSAEHDAWVNYSEEGHMKFVLTNENRLFKPNNGRFEEVPSAAYISD